jgi:hypothetical protein
MSNMGWGLDWTRLPLASPRSARHEGAESLWCNGTLALCFCSRASSISAWEAMRDGPSEESVGHAPSAMRPDQDEKSVVQ